MDKDLADRLEQEAYEILFCTSDARAYCRLKATAKLLREAAEVLRAVVPLYGQPCRADVESVERAISEDLGRWMQADFDRRFIDGALERTLDRAEMTVKREQIIARLVGSPDPEQPHWRDCLLPEKKKE